jgi:metal-responsive CopG/Arc/MetJ family transcriptional regulator
MLQMTDEDTERKATTFTIRVEVSTLESIDKVLYGGELRSEFARRAIKAELRRREQAKRSE